MSVAEIAETKYNMMQLVPMHVRAVKATQYDWFVIGEYPGVIYNGGAMVIQPSSATGAGTAETLTRGYLTVSVGGYTTASTAITYDATSRNFTGRVVPYYVRSSSGEVMLVRTDSGSTTTTGTITVQRACFGTTASTTGIADNDLLEVLNAFTMDISTIGVMEVMLWPMPQDPKFGGWSAGTPVYNYNPG